MAGLKIAGRGSACGGLGAIGESFARKTRHGWEAFWEAQFTLAVSHFGPHHQVWPDWNGSSCSPNSQTPAQTYLVQPHL